MPSNPLLRTLIALCLGAIGATIGYFLHLPVYLLTGPAIFITILGLAGLQLSLDSRFRDAAFVVIGISIGAGITEEATAAVLTWPLAFVALAIMLWAILFFSRAMLTRWFGDNRKTAILASSPGHLSFVISMGMDAGADVVRISVVQSVRLLALTLVVPFAALFLGIEVNASFTSADGTMSLPILAAILAVSLALGFALKRTGLPAPLLLGGLFTSTAAHASGIVHGGLPAWVALPAFCIMGTLIGSRFSGITLATLRQCFAAGVAITCVSVSLAFVAAVPVSRLLDMPVAHVLIAFAPGGLETMIAMGIVLGANPGFTAAAHVMRLLILTVLVPAMLGRKKPEAEPET
ncbi:AbrB family transcriptional regulator [Algicella marina]|uniref:AbrB family transcriptional regulator n=1 Tax=Algicella marina TaxID=2683284 RepID=A0A6P1SZC9_9RHOB|nr:AbrB family transcriptional regulator [Algicella marina]QHQ36044.1 AbrB family transcriptional regulator [Algicella marina]